jgi:calmodulin
LPIIFADLTIQHNKDYVKSIGVLALPTVQFYAHGKRADTFPCGPSKVPILKKKLAAFVNQNVDSTTLKVKPSVEGLVGEQLAGAEAASATKPAETAENFIQQVKSKLRSVVYFADMLESEFESMLSRANLLTFDSGSIIMREGNPGRTFYYIVDGDVEICQRTSYEDPLTIPPSYLGTVINRFETGDYFGERALIVGEPRAASIRASSTTKCLTFDKDNFPPSCILSGQTGNQESELEVLSVINDKYGVALSGIGAATDKALVEAAKASQARGSPNTPRPINGVDNDIDEDEEVSFDPVEGAPAPTTTIHDNAQVIVPLLIRFKLIRLVTRCFDYIMENKPTLSDPSVRRRREMLVKLLAPSQRVEFTDAYNLIDADGDGEITLVELRRLMDSVGEERSDEDLVNVIAQSRQGMDGKEVLTYRDFMGLMAESELYFLFLETFRDLDKMDTGFVRAKDLDRVLCGIRDLITDDKHSIIDVEDTEMMVDYEQFSRMLLGTSLK